jgi:hypothetical protein
MADPGTERAAAVKAGITRHILDYGATLTYKRGGSSTTIRCRYTTMGNALRFQWFTSAEVTGWPLPALVVQVAGDFLPFTSQPAAADIVVIPAAYLGAASQDFDVKKFYKNRIDGVVTATYLLLADT